jgi:hypothetical protein
LLVPGVGAGTKRRKDHRLDLPAHRLACKLALIIEQRTNHSTGNRIEISSSISIRFNLKFAAVNFRRSFNSLNCEADKMSLTVLYPDAQFTGEADIERKVFGANALLHIFRARHVGEIPMELWSSSDAILCFDIEIRANNIADASRCRQIVRAGVGFDNIDIAAAAAKSIPVCNTPDYGTTDVADHAIGMMLALTRGIVAYNEVLKTEGAAGWNFMRAPTVRRITGCVFGIIGLGRIGTATALRAKALGMKVVFFDPYKPSGTELALGVGRVDQLEALSADQLCT